MKDAEKIERQLEMLRYEQSKESLQRVVGNLTDALERQKQNRPANKPVVWRIIMNSRITKLAAAAVIIIGVMAGVHFLGGSLDGTSAVYAAAIEALQQVDTVHVWGWTKRIEPMHSFAMDEPFDTSKEYPLEIWEWFTQYGGYRRYEKQGPIIFWDDGESRYEYDSDKDRLNVSKSLSSRHLMERFRSMADVLESLKERGIKLTELGTRVIGGKEARGVKAERDDRRHDIWIDIETNLLLENNAYKLEDGHWVEQGHRRIAYDANVPAEISGYVPPEAGQTFYDWSIDPRFEKWHQRLRQITAYYQSHPLPETMELIERESAEDFEAYAPGDLGEITRASGYWVLPIGKLGWFLQARVASAGMLRVPREIQEIEVYCDLVTTNDHTPRQRADFVLDALGFEIVEVAEERTVWVAHYDGRQLKPWREVKAPVPNPDNKPLHTGMAATWGGSAAGELFNSFVYYQDTDLTAKGIIIIDQTGLPSKAEHGRLDETAVSYESPYWGGQKAIGIAKKWFEEEFGITFTEEKRMMNVSIVRKKQ